jgi:Icc-related predicted phosphoesterase
MAFNRTRGPALAAVWAGIPDGLDLLVTHGPPRGIGDRAVFGNVGCDHLRAAVLARPPRLHVFGHIHEARGRYEIPGVRTVFYNVANRGIASFGLRPAMEIDAAPA